MTPIHDLTATAYQRAYELYHGKKAPKITRGSGGGYVIHGEGGPSPSRSAVHVQKLTNWMKREVEARV
ncbi:hypothetical protein [Rhizobium sp.]|uniref:hypothetical protein n=1 Tax=Rhizobium sp. TaxID=391 RepID=UPI003F7EB79B